MRCITFGVCLVLLIIILVLSPLVGSTIAGLASAAIIVWWLVGFFVECDEYNFDHLKL
jgi:uncharacterized membrane protein